MVAFTTAVYVLSLLSALAAPTAAVQILPGYKPRLPRDHLGGISKRAKLGVDVRRDVPDLQLVRSSTLSRRQQVAGESEVRGARQTLSEVSG